MYVAYDGTRLPKDSTKVERTITAVSPAGVPLWQEHAWTLTCVLNPDNVGGATAEQIAGNYAATVESVFALFARRNRRLSVITDGGVEVMALPPVPAGGQGTGPTAVVRANPVGEGTEFAGARTLTVTVTAVYPVADLSTALVAFRETLTLRGNGAPAKVLRVGMAGSAIQYPRAASIAYATQAGTATGAVARPLWAVPGPLWPGPDCDTDQSVSVLESANRQGDMLNNFTVAWSYSFSRVGKPFVGVPHEFR